MNDQTLGQILKTARTAENMSLRDVERATRGKISNGHLSLLEADQVKQPSPHHMFLLAAVLKLDYGRLLRLAGYVVPGEAPQAPNPDTASLVSKTSDFSSAELHELENYADYIRSRRSR